jgi:hypothetical protein
MLFFEKAKLTLNPKLNRFFDDFIKFQGEIFEILIPQKSFQINDLGALT